MNWKDKTLKDIIRQGLLLHSSRVMRHSQQYHPRNQKKIMEDVVFRILNEFKDLKNKFEENSWGSDENKAAMEEENKYLKEKVEGLKEQLKDKNEIIAMLKEKIAGLAGQQASGDASS